MDRSWIALAWICFFYSVAVVASPPEGSTSDARGAVVEEASEGFAAHRAGLEAGDVLLGWHRAAAPDTVSDSARGRIDSPFDLLEAELEQAPRGVLTLIGTRDGTQLRVPMPPGLWKLRTRPRLTPPALEAYRQGALEPDGGDPRRGRTAWRRLASAWGSDGDWLKASWLWLRLASVAGERRDWQAADEAFDQAMSQARSGGHASLEALVVSSRADSLHARGELEAAAEAYRQALEIRRASSPESLAVARSLHDLGIVARKRGDGSSEEQYNRRALALREKLAPESLDVAMSLNSLGIAAGNRSDMAESERLFRRSLAIRERLVGNSLQVAASLGNLGIIAWQRGDLAASEYFFRRCLTIHEELAPGGPRVAASLSHLGSLVLRRGDPVAAEAYFRRSLAMHQQLAPRSFNVARTLNNLGSALLSRGDSAAAEGIYRRSLVILEQLAPHSLDVQGNLNNLARAVLERGDLAAAEAYLTRALAITEKQAPESLGHARTSQLLGDVAFARADLDQAEARYRRSLDIRRKRAPGSLDEAEACQRLAVYHRGRGDLAPALGFYECAVAALEAQKGRLGGSDEARSEFGAQVAGTYRQAIDLLAEMDRGGQAFDMLERFRARELLALLAARDLVFASDLPQELEDRRRSANRTYDLAFDRWLRLPEQASDEDRRRAHQQLEQARQRQDEIRAEVRAAAPRLAALQDPEPLDLEATRATLDAGTLLLSYSIGEERSLLFAVGPDDSALEVFALAAGEDWMRGAVEDLREALARGQFDRRSEKVLDRGRRLSERLLAPVAGRIERAERLLILADGPLHSLPFAALTDPGSIDGRRYLIESKPIHLAASATVFARIQHERRKRRAVRLAAFGDPQVPTNQPLDNPDTRLRSVLRGFELTPLPATRAEVEGLRRLYPETSRVYLGAEATEGRLKAVDSETTHLHIASHGILDNRSPLDSALVFSIPERWREGEDNGLLQAWEIFEQVRLDADLVTLSACDTGLGKVLGGEGLLGLTRAFQYAGARSVFASLWSVSDTSTGELMQRFYGYLKAGESKAEALRSAQLDLLRSPERSHPFHWAGFQLIGDWR